MFSYELHNTNNKETPNGLFSSYEDLGGICMVFSLWITVLNQINQFCRCMASPSKGKSLKGASQPLAKGFSLNPTICLTYNEFALNQYEQRILKVLCWILKNSFDANLVRRFMVKSFSETENWTPPSFYWRLMSTSMTVHTMKYLCKKERRSEFLHSFLEDFFHHQIATQNNWRIRSDPALSCITSSFTLFHRTLAEVICDFLVMDDEDDLGMQETSRLCQLLCQSENAYLYSQAMLHFLPLWRPDFMACRQLSLVLYQYMRNTLASPQVANISLSCMGFEAFPNLRRVVYALFSQDFNVPLPEEMLCSLSEIVHNVVQGFQQYQTLLYPRLGSKQTHVQQHHALEDASTWNETLHHAHPNSTHKRQIHQSPYVNKRPCRSSKSFPSPYPHHSNFQTASHSHPHHSPQSLTTSHDPQETPRICHPRLTIQPSTEMDYHPNAKFFPPPAATSSDGAVEDDLFSSYSRSLEKKNSSFWDSHTSDGTYDSSDVMFKPQRYVPEAIVLDLPPASQSGKVWKEEYNRLGYSPQHCPLLAIRSELFLETLLRNLICSLTKTSPIVLHKMINLLLNLTTLNAYEILIDQNDQLEILNAKRHKHHHFHHDERPLPGHWTTEGAYNLEEERLCSEEGHSDHGEDDLESEEHYVGEDKNEEDESFYSQGLRLHRNLDQAFTSVESSYNVTQTVRIGLGSAKIGAPYNPCIHPVVYSSFMDGKQQDELQKDHVLTSSPSDVSKETSGGSWLDSVWQKGASVIPPGTQDGSNINSSLTGHSKPSKKKGHWKSSQDQETSLHGPLEHQDTCSLYNLIQPTETEHSHHSLCSSHSFLLHSDVSKPQQPKSMSSVTHLCTSLSSDLSPTASSWSASSDCTSIERALLGTPSCTDTLSHLDPSPNHDALSPHPCPSLLERSWDSQNPHTSPLSFTPPPFDHETRRSITFDNPSEKKSSTDLSSTSFQPHRKNYVPDASSVLHLGLLHKKNKHDTLNSSFYTSATQFHQESHFNPPTGKDLHPGRVKSSVSKPSKESSTTSFLSDPHSVSTMSFDQRIPFDNASLEVYSFSSEASPPRHPSESTLAGKTLEMKSTMDSNIFRDPQGHYTLGPHALHHLHVSSSRHRFRQWTKRVNEYKEVARQDLLNASIILSSPSCVSSYLQVALLLRCTNSLVGASILLSFLKHKVLFLDQKNIDSLLSVSPVVLTVFMAVCQRHPKKKKSVIQLLHQCFIKSSILNKNSCKTHPLLTSHDQPLSGTSHRKNPTSMKATYSSELYQTTHVPKSLLRRELELILSFCKAPFSPAFLTSLLDLLHQVICVQEALDMVSDVNRTLRTHVLESLVHVHTCWNPGQPPQHVLNRFAALQKSLSGLK